jgi:hypothetical protein
MRMMRRVGILMAAVMTLAALAVYAGDRVHSGGDAKRTLPPPLSAGGPARSKITLLAQEQGAYGTWTTKRRLSISCRAHPSFTRSAPSLCEALHYYASHPPQACVVRGGLAITRVVILGQLGRRSAKLRMGPVCNPPPVLSRAVQVIHVAAFKSVTMSRQLVGPGALRPDTATAPTA